MANFSSIGTPKKMAVMPAQSLEDDLTKATVSVSIWLETLGGGVVAVMTRITPARQATYGYRNLWYPKESKMLALLSSLIFAFSVSVQARELTCMSGKISQIEFEKLKEESADYCFNGDKTVLLSKNCQQKKCKAFEDKRRFKIGELLSQIGKPSFRLCRELGGKPEIVEFFVQNQPYKLDRCLFKDGSFADSDFLLAHYLER